MSLAPALGALGAPAIRVVPPEPVRELTGVRRDVAAFFGVAPRGPAWLPPATLEPDVDVAGWLATTRRRRSVPVTVTSWDEYRLHFGGFEGPGRLPYAVSAFFAGGGERAEVVRIVHAHPDRYTDAGARAHGVLGHLATTGGTPISLFARSEGRWGNRLRARLSFTTRPLVAEVDGPAELLVDEREWVPRGSLLRLTEVGGGQELRLVDRSVDEPHPDRPRRRRRLTLVTPATSPPERAEIVTACLEVIDHDPAFARREVLADLGLRADHPRWLARAVILESTLVWPDESWSAGTVDLTDPTLPPVDLVGPDPLNGDRRPPHMDSGVDLWDEIVPEDFWDEQWVLGDEVPGDGVQCLADHADVGLLVAPDLYEPEPLPERDDVEDLPTLCGPEFAPHLEIEPPAALIPPSPGLQGLAIAHDLPRIIEAQLALVAYAEDRRDLTVLLDVPPMLPPREVLRWRTCFDSPFAAAYHPWADVAPTEDQREALVRINPSAFAAGIIAERERRLGVQHGPANQIAVGAVRLADAVAPDLHDELHLSGINVFVAERDGIRLTGARTLSRVAALRQLSVARLMTILRLTLEREMRWAVFEPNNPTLWAEVRRLVHGLLTRLYAAGAFRGATTKDAFFVTCDRTTMTQNDLDNGRLVCLVGVAPAEPIEHVIIELAVASTSGVKVEVRG